MWEYDIALFLFKGWERWELTSIDADTGVVIVNVTGERSTDAFTISYERQDSWRCDAEGLWNLGWSSTWTITDRFGTFSESADATNVWQYAQLFLRQDPMEGDRWLPWIVLDTTTSDGYSQTDRGNDDFTLAVGAVEDMEVLGVTTSVLPVYRAEELPESWGNDSYTSYYAEDIGLVRRDDLILTDFTPGP